MATLVQHKYSCPDCDAEFTAQRKLDIARCISCGSMRTELVRKLTPLILVDEDRPALLLSSAPPEPETPPELEDYSEPKGPEKSTDVTSMFACVDCALKFIWNFTQRGRQDPFCPRCKSATVKEISPRASAIIVVKGKIPKILSKRELKRVRFIRRHWRMRCDLRDYVEGLNNLLDRLGFDGTTIHRARNTMNELLAEVDHQQQLRLNQYDEIRMS